MAIVTFCKYMQNKLNHKKTCTGKSKILIKRLLKNLSFQNCRSGGSGAGYLVVPLHFLTITDIDLICLFILPM